MAVLHSNDVIEAVTNSNLVKGAGKFLKQGFEDAWDVGAKSLESRNLSKALESQFKTANGWDYKRMAGAGFVVAGSARLATGGGLTKDANGNQNIIGLPFI